MSWLVLVLFRLHKSYAVEMPFDVFFFFNFRIKRMPCVCVVIPFQETIYSKRIYARQNMRIRGGSSTYAHQHSIIIPSVASDGLSLCRLGWLLLALLAVLLFCPWPLPSPFNVLGGACSWLGLKDVDEIVKFISILKTFNWIMFFLIFLFDVWINLQFPVLYLIVYETHDHYMYKVNYNSFIIVSAGR